jgi:hypothetical protein
VVKTKIPSSHQESNPRTLIVQPTARVKYYQMMCRITKHGESEGILKEVGMACFKLQKFSIRMASSLFEDTSKIQIRCITTEMNLLNEWTKELCTSFIGIILKPKSTLWQFICYY